MDEQRSQTKRGILRSCNPLKSAELNPYWVDFEKKGGDRDALTWSADDGSSIKYDKGIRNSLCGGGGGGGQDDDGGKREKYGPFNMDGFTKASKSISGTTKTSSSLLPVGETSLGSVDDGTTTTSPPPLLSSTSLDEDIGKAIDTSSFLSSSAATPSSLSIVLQDNNKNNNKYNDEEATIRFDSKLFARRRNRTRTRNRAVLYI